MVKLIRSARAIRYAALSLIVVAGCGGAPTDNFKGARGTVTGEITFEGTPIPEGSQVLFMATEGGYMASGTVNSSGVYSLTCNGSSKLPAVKYLVQLAPPVKKPAMPEDPTKMAQAGSAKKKAVKGETTGPFPGRYSSTSSSQLDFTVEEGTNVADFELTP
jgi:hypothetical protein